MPKQRYWNGLEWEVLGTDASKVDILDSEGLYEATDVEGALAEVADDLLRHRNEYAQQAHLAKNIGLQDAAGKFTATELESAMLELFTFANNGKTGWATVVGSPLAGTDTFAQLKSKTQTIKNTLAANLTNKGQSSEGTETLANLVGKVANISTGKKWASGTGLTTGTVSGLDFTPNIIIVDMIYDDTPITFHRIIRTGMANDYFENKRLYFSYSVQKIESADSGLTISYGGFTFPYFAKANWYASE